jgi:hybrid polyketide synthase/nonribosomal peptide synthetase ACE1
MVVAYKDNLALKDHSGHSLSYGQMGKRIDQIVSYILCYGIERNSYIGIFQTRTIDWICSFLAVLRLGAVAVPLDTQLGFGRLQLMVQVCDAAAILVDDSTIFEAKSLTVNRSSAIINVCYAQSPGESLPPNYATSQGSAVLMYTSGSTGTPKGIIQKHEAYRNFVEFAPPRWGFMEGCETVLQQSSYAFDMSIAQIFVCLAYGGTLIVVNIDQHRDPAAICRILISEAVTFTLATPSEYFAWTRYGSQNGRLSKSSLRGAVSAGESMPESLLQAFRSLNISNLRLVNAYGPTETTFACADCLVSLTATEMQASLLQPLPNYCISVVDDDLRPLPSGILGQVLIGGAGVANGYLSSDKALSASFSATSYMPGSYVKNGWHISHLSGDLGKIDARGRLVILGRIDGSTQIKRAGIRIDLQDIERTIEKTFPSKIRQAVVSNRRRLGTSEGFLVAFICFSTHGVPQTERDSILKGLCQQIPVPSWMRPSIALELLHVPLTPSNKIDRLSIDLIPLPTLGSGEEPNSQLTEPDVSEQLMIKLWREVLPEHALSAISQENGNVDFFQMGGTSLSLISLQTLIRDYLGTTVPLQRLFESSTLKQMASFTKEVMNEVQQNVAEIDWDAEGIFFSGQSQESTTQVPIAAIPPQVVILTGSTGFVGHEILEKLVSEASISAVHCVAVRKPLHLWPDIFKHPKVTVYSGDLSAPQLGLSDNEAEQIFEMADAIIHNGADVSFLKSYQSLRHTNLNSTMELVRLSAPRRLHFHYISTLSVTRLTEQQDYPATSVAKFRPGRKVNGYVASKWASEIYLESAHEEWKRHRP